MFRLGSIMILSVMLLLAATAPAQQLRKITMGYPSLAFTQSHVWVAKEQGLFRKYGLDVDPVFLRGGQVATQALAAGEPPIVNVGTVIQANLTGYNLVLIISMENKFYQLVFVRPGITSLEQLKGKRLGISGFGSITHYAAQILLKHLNFEPNKDVALIAGGPDAERLGAMSAGKIDASFFNLSTAPIARKMGFIDLLQIADLGVEVQGNGLATSRPYLKSNRDTVKNAMKGYLEAIHFIHANKAGRKSLPNICAPTILRCSRRPIKITSRRSPASQRSRQTEFNLFSTCSHRRCPRRGPRSRSSFSIRA